MRAAFVFVFFSLVVANGALMDSKAMVQQKEEAKKFSGLIKGAVAVAGAGALAVVGAKLVAKVSELPYATKHKAAMAVMGEHTRAVGMPAQIYKGSKSDPNGGHGTGDTEMMARYGHNGVGFENIFGTAQLGNQGGIDTGFVVTTQLPGASSEKYPCRFPFKTDSTNPCYQPVRKLPPVAVDIDLPRPIPELQMDFISRQYLGAAHEVSPFTEFTPHPYQQPDWGARTTMEVPNGNPLTAKGAPKDDAKYSELEPLGERLPEPTIAEKGINLINYGITHGISKAR